MINRFMKFFRSFVVAIGAVWAVLSLSALLIEIVARGMSRPDLIFAWLIALGLGIALIYTRKLETFPDWLHRINRVGVKGRSKAGAQDPDQ